MHRMYAFTVVLCEIKIYRELSLVLCDILEGCDVGGWEGGSRGRGYMDSTHGHHQMVNTEIRPNTAKSNK